MRQSFLLFYPFISVIQPCFFFCFFICTCNQDGCRCESQTRATDKQCSACPPPASPRPPPRPPPTGSNGTGGGEIRAGRRAFPVFPSDSGTPPCPRRAKARLQLSRLSTGAEGRQRATGGCHWSSSPPRPGRVRGPRGSERLGAHPARSPAWFSLSSGTFKSSFLVAGTKASTGTKMVDESRKIIFHIIFFHFLFFCSH